MVAKGVKKESATPKKESKKVYRKSPARIGVSKSPSESSIRTTSPSRRPALRKSPSRSSSTTAISKSPSRRSPGRSSSRLIKEKQKAVPELPKRTSRSQEPIEIESDSEDSDTNLAAKFLSDKPKATVRGRARKQIESTSSKSLTPIIREVFIPIRNDLKTYMARRSVSKQPLEESHDIKQSKPDPHLSSIKKLTELSDEDDIKFLNENSVRSSLSRRSVSRLTDKMEIVTRTDWLKALLGCCLMPLTAIFYNIFCNEVQCDYTKLPNLSKYKDWRTYFDSASMAISSSFGVLILLVSAIPFGGFKVTSLPNKQGKLDYRMNGILVTISASILLVILEIYDVPVIENIIDKYFQFYIGLIIMGFFISVWLYIRSFYVPLCSLSSNALTNGRMHNFFFGREVNPRLFGTIDIKMWIHRFFFNASIIINAIYIYKDLEIGKNKEDGTFDFKSIKYNPTLLIVTVTQIFYLLHYQIFENTLVTTSTVQYDPVGFLMVSLITFGPLLMGAAPKYIYDYGIKLPIWYLILSTIIFCVGYVLYHASNFQKHTFRQYPYNPSISHLETLPTSQGKKLLVSGYWGWVRHPNHLGAILVHVSFAMSVYNAMPALLHILNIFALINRAHDNDTSCTRRYGSAWQIYCERVKYVLIPKIY